ncbi:MAG: hypothetical protein Q9166_006927 [cf. Caloplaca sp. 2 TL-2023]
MALFNIVIAYLLGWGPSQRFFAEAAPAAGPFDEILQAQGLLGSHFGQVSIPASYDYVVIGGGTAGLTIARRLAESHTVAVIEAGSLYELDNGNFTEIPADASYYLGKDPTFYNPLIDWRQKTTPQPGFDGASVYYPQGRTLGGSSARNFMWYQRGSVGSYQKWADVVGDTTYSFANLLPFFKKSVKFTGPNQRVRAANAIPKFDPDAFSASGGPLQVSYPNYASPAASLLSRGLNAIGLKELPGMSSGDLLGWTWITDTLDPTTQVRSTSESAFLREALQSNNNLVTYRNTLAKKVLFDANKRAIGVTVESAGLGSGSVVYTINATKEVILSAGTFRSPQMLMVSGIGPASTLRENNIQVVADRPGVGQDMWDHIFFGPSYEVNTVTHSSLGNPAFAAVATQEYTTSRTGILTNVGGDLLDPIQVCKWRAKDALAFEKLPKGAVTSRTRSDLDATFGLDWPDIELLSLDAYTGHLNDFLTGAPDLKNYTAICIAIIAPFSRGNVSISSSDTNIHPVVNPNWLDDPRDREVAVAAFKRARAVFQAQEVRPLLVGSEAFPGDAVQTDEQILQVITSSSSTIHHAAGTCRMGKANDPLAVVDSRGMFKSGTKFTTLPTLTTLY